MHGLHTHSADADDSLGSMRVTSCARDRAVTASAHASKPRPATAVLRVLRCGDPYDGRMLVRRPLGPTVAVCRALILCSQVGWVDSSRDHPRGARSPSFSARSAAVNSIARPWSAANRSAAYSDRRLISALAN